MLIALEIRNTIIRLERDYKDFEIIPNVFQFLKDSLSNSFIDKDAQVQDKDLFIKNETYLLVPELQYGAYYNINNVNVYKYVSF